MPEAETSTSGFKLHKSKSHTNLHQHHHKHNQTSQPVDFIYEPHGTGSHSTGINGRRCRRRSFQFGDSNLTPADFLCHQNPHPQFKCHMHWNEDRGQKQSANLRHPIDLTMSSPPPTILHHEHDKERRHWNDHPGDFFDKNILDVVLLDIEKSSIEPGASGDALENEGGADFKDLTGFASHSLSLSSLKLHIASRPQLSRLDEHLPSTPSSTPVLTPNRSKSIECQKSPGLEKRPSRTVVFHQTSVDIRKTGMFPWSDAAVSSNTRSHSHCNVPLHHAKTSGSVSRQKNFNSQLRRLKTTLFSPSPSSISTAPFASPPSEQETPDSYFPPAFTRAPSFPRNSRYKSTDDSKLSPLLPSTFTHIPLQHFDTIESDSGFKASMEWRLKERKQSQSHVTIHSFSPTEINSLVSDQQFVGRAKSAVLCNVRDSSTSFSVATKKSSPSPNSASSCSTLPTTSSASSCSTLPMTSCTSTSSTSTVPPLVKNSRRKTVSLISSNFLVQSIRDVFYGTNNSRSNSESHHGGVEI